jgi:hypothetical protein
VSSDAKAMVASLEVAARPGRTPEGRSDHVRSPPKPVAVSITVIGRPEPIDPAAVS